MTSTRRPLLTRGFKALCLLSILTLSISSPAVRSFAGSAPPRFARNFRLPGGQGAEPSIAIDATQNPGLGDIYVVAIGDPNGPLEWHSYDHGKTFAKPVPFDQNGPVRGGDSDVAVARNGDVVAVDLDVSHASVQISTDRGKTFDQGTVTAPEDDRPWVSTHRKTVYIAYHDFTAEVPVVCTSFDGGRTFSRCDQTFGQNNPPAVGNCAENTIPARALAWDPVTHSLNFLYSCSTAGENLKHPPYGPLHDYYLAQSTDGGQSWKTYKAFVASTKNGKRPNYANIFARLSIDSRGNYYMVTAGTSDDRDPARHPYHVYLLVSRNHGHTWSRPIRIDHDRNGRGTHVFPDMTVTTPGSVDIVWYGTSRTGEPNGVCGSFTNQSPCKDGFPNYKRKTAPAWHVFMAHSRDALSAHPTWTQVRVDRSPGHYGRICTNGIVCGSSDRTLLDFISVGVDCRGFAHIVYGSNTKKQESRGKTFVRVANQVGGEGIRPPGTCR